MNIFKSVVFGIITMITISCSTQPEKKEDPIIYQCTVSSESGQMGLIWYVKIPEEQMWVTFSKIIVKCNKQTKEMCIISTCKVVKELPDAETLDALKEEMQKRQKEKDKIYT